MEAEDEDDNAEDEEDDDEDEVDERLEVKFLAFMALLMTTTS